MKHKISDSARSLVFLGVTFSFLLLNSCQHEDLDVYIESENYRNAADFTANNYELTLFHAAMETAGLLDTLRGEGPFTLFAPSNQAFNDIGIVRASDFAAMNQDSLRFMMLYHILPRRLYREDIPDLTIDNMYENLTGRQLHLGYQQIDHSSSIRVIDYLAVNGAQAPQAYQNALLANGVLHMLNKVLKYNSGTVQDILEDRPEFSIFVAALKHFGEWDRLSEPGPWTVFAPVNEGFESLGLTIETIRALDPTDYRSRQLLGVYIVSNHVFLSDLEIFGRSGGSGYFGNTFLRGPVPGAEAFSFGIASNAARQPFVIATEPVGGNTPIRTADHISPSQSDYKAENGVVHAITGLLVYPEEALIN
ncbi:fasciclin domain-containing protein [Sphingobacterium haloxyli]|uniref:FAS1 domain-containing protein n=1 Tax=Sphingobacterium haloxyli TaxID=2100533 RepID=A0A2S9J500_9SPHI|nr:fasciclin domain-containing protein [Sphingobacterium haloxyli]PRD47824.1 hypothetical protein C5745_07870 [Sphingobacterium haloxyli]